MHQKYTRIAAVVVLYNPPPEVVGNIASFAGQVDRVYAVDNTETPGGFAAEVKTVDNVEYLPQGENIGVAAALNLAAARAIAEGFDLLLTMDQDSRATPGMVATMVACIENYPDSVGIVSPFHAIKGEPDPSCRVSEEVLTVMTSGNLLNLAVYRKAGPFLDELFIDHVDDEYCLRLNTAGYKVIRCSQAVLEHNLGNITAHRRHGGIIHVSNQNALRRYYMTRNRFHLIRTYRRRFPDYCRQLLVNLRGELKGVILFEDDKLRKLWMTARGYIDYRRGKMGKFC